jgi:hypothetical protein
LPRVSSERYDRKSLAGFQDSFSGHLAKFVACAIITAAHIACNSMPVDYND